MKSPGNCFEITSGFLNSIHGVPQGVAESPV